MSVTSERVNLADVAAVHAEVERIAKEVVAPAADAVDAENRFPHEAVDALRAAGLLTLPTPVEYGGAGLSVLETGRALQTLAGADASLGLILIMHWSQLELLARYGTTAELRAFQRDAVVNQWLVASANSEIAIRGNERASTCFVDDQGDGSFLIVKDSPVISFGEHADAYLVTARRTAESAPGDQVLVAVKRSDSVVEPTGPWDALGFRGSQSKPFHLEGRGALGMVLPLPYDKIVNEAGLPVTNVLWAHMWLGMAEAAAAKAHKWARTKGKGTPEKPGMAPFRTAELLLTLDAMRGLVAYADQRFAAVDGTDESESLAFITQLQTLKVGGSDLLVEVVSGAFSILGLAGFRNGSEWSLGRQLRDAHGAALMVSNDSILAQNAQLLLVRKTL